MALRAFSSPWNVVPAVLVVVLAVAVAESPLLGLAAVAALAVLAAMVRFPVVMLMVPVLAAQEIRPAEGRFGGMTSLGHQLYFVGLVPAIVLLAALATVVAVARGGWPRMTGGGKAVLVLGSLLATLATVMGLYGGQSPMSALNQNARPFVLLVCGLLVGASIRALGGECQRTERATSWALAALAAGAALAVAAGQSADASVSPLFIYYDSATSAAAGAVLLGVLFAGEGQRGRTIVAVAALVIVVFGFRRNVWLAAAMSLLVALLFSRSRLRAWAPIALATVPATAVLAVFPDVAAALGTRITDAWYAITGKVGEDSTDGHVRDLEVGWRYVEQHFWAGVGPNAPQLTGLAAAGPGRVYVHNEWLLDWLRFGFVGVTLVAVLTVVLIVMAAGVLRRRGSDTMEWSAAMFLLIAPVSMMTAPFLSTTSRWPLLIGLAAGVLAGMSAARQEECDVPDPTKEFAALR